MLHFVVKYTPSGIHMSLCGLLTIPVLITHNDDDRKLIEALGIHYYSEETIASITIPGTVENNTALVHNSASRSDKI